MIKALVLGANGFLGKKLVTRCISRGWMVDGVVNQNKNAVDTGISRVISSDTLDEFEKEEYQYVFNTAAYIPYGAYNTINEKLVEANIQLVLKSHQLFPKAKLVFASSASVYGSNTHVLHERSDYISPTLYGLSKLSGELIAMHHENFSIIRFSSLYGKGMNKTTFLPRIVQDAKTKKEITLWGSGKRKQNYLAIDDAAEYCIHAALHGKKEVYLGVHPVSYTNNEVAEFVAGYFKDCSIVHKGEDSSPSLEYNNTHTREALNFTPTYNLETGIKELIDG